MSATTRYLIPDLPSADELVPYLKRIDSARQYSNFGPLACEFETRLSALLSDVDRLKTADPIQVSTVASGHGALEIGLRVLGIGRGQKVLVPAVTFASCGLAVKQAGAEPVFVDVDPTTWTLTPEIARSVLSHSTIDAIMPVSIYGVPVPATEWDDISVRLNVPVLIDAAAALESQPVPRDCLIAHSFHATKPFGIGEGGALVGRSAETISRCRQYSNFGTVGRICYMEGTNGKLSEYHAAVGLAQLDRWADIKRRRHQLLRQYIEQLQCLSEFVSLQPNLDRAVPSCLMLLLTEPVADFVIAEAERHGCTFHRTYLPPLYRHPYFSDATVVASDGSSSSELPDVTHKRRSMRTSESLFQRLVGVPFHSFMNEEDVTFVATVLKKLLPLAYHNRHNPQ